MLARQTRSVGLLERRPVAYTVRIAATLLFYAASWAAVVWVGDAWWQMITAFVLGVAFTQVAFLGHDGGHQQIFAGRRANDLFGQLTGNLLVASQQPRSSAACCPGDQRRREQTMTTQATRRRASRQWVDHVVAHRVVDLRPAAGLMARPAQTSIIVTHDDAALTPTHSQNAGCAA